MDDTNLVSINSAVTIPALQALTSAVFVGGAVGGIIAAAGSLELLTVSPVAVGIISGSVSGLWSWRQSMNDWRGGVYGIPYQEPKQEPSIIPPPVRVELSSNKGRTMQFVDLPADVDQLIQLGAGLVEGLSFTEAEWCGAGAPFSRNQFVRLRSAMIQRGLAAWNSTANNARGARVTGKGMALCRHFASMTTYPPTLERTR